MGCLRGRLALLYSQPSTVPRGYICGQALRGDGQSAWTDVAACPWDSACLFLASQVLAWPLRSFLGSCCR